MSAAKDRLNADKLVNQAIDVMRHASNDLTRERAAYLLARSALLIVQTYEGAETAAGKAYALADELATAGGRD